MLVQARVQELEHAVLLRTSALEQAKHQLSAKGLAENTFQPDREDSNDSDQVSCCGFHPSSHKRLLVNTSDGSCCSEMLHAADQWLVKHE